MASTESSASPIERAGETVESITDRLQRSASVTTVYGEPIERGGKVIVPVARVAYGFGGGSGEGDDDGGTGSGFGGGVAARPAGVVEVTDDDTRFVRAADRKRLLAALAVGFVLGRLFGRRR